MADLPANIRRVLEESNLPIEVATAIADALDQRSSAAQELPAVADKTLPFERRVSTSGQDAYDADNAQQPAQSDDHQTPETDALMAKYDNTTAAFSYLGELETLARSLERRLRAAEVALSDAEKTSLLHIAYGQDQQRHWCATQCKGRVYEAEERAEKAKAELRKRYECRFSSGGVQSKTCEFHERQLRAAKGVPDPLSQALNEGDGVYRP